MLLYETLPEDNEMNLIKWLAEHESLKDEMIMFYLEYDDEETGELLQVFCNGELNISINIDYLKNCIRFQDLIDKYYYVIFDKFKVDIGEIKDGARLGDDIE